MSLYYDRLEGSDIRPKPLEAFFHSGFGFVCPGARKTKLKGVILSMKEIILGTPGLISFWDFQENGSAERIAQGPYPYRLHERGEGIEGVPDGWFGPVSAHFTPGSWLEAPRDESPALNIHGEEAQVTVIAWVKREIKDHRECEAVAGMWNETLKQRQYCLFLNLGIWDSSQQVCGHVSSVGGPTPGYKYCMDAAIGNTPVPFGQWQCVAFSYDGQQAKAFLNGRLDIRQTYNPYLYEGGLFNGGDGGANFTVGAVHRKGEMGNWYTGLIGGLAVFNRALSEQELQVIGNVERRPIHS